MKYYIYQLKTNNECFYIGRTINPHRRKLEHIRGGKDVNTTELKYDFIKELNKINQEWELEVIATYIDNKHNYEDFHIYQAIQNGASLTNMKAGDIYEEATSLLTKQYTEPNAFFHDRELKAQQLKAKTKQNLNRSKTKQKKYSKTGAFIEDLQDTIKGKTQSTGLKTLMDRLNKRKR